MRNNSEMEGIEDDQQLSNKTVAILATNGVEQVELTKPKQALEQAGARTN